MKKVGVLALQGDFEAHARALERAGARPVEARTAADLQDLDGLVIPGGESTTMLKLLNRENMVEPLAQFGRERPIFGTCAGAILMASEVTSPAQQSLHLMDIAVERNAYGRQIDSRVAQLSPETEFEKRTHPGELEAVFIRAPIIQRVGPRRPRAGHLSGRPGAGRTGQAPGRHLSSRADAGRPGARAVSR